VLTLPASSGTLVEEEMEHPTKPHFPRRTYAERSRFSSFNKGLWWAVQDYAHRFVESPNKNGKTRVSTSVYAG
jgi:hypothetical protein